MVFCFVFIGGCSVKPYTGESNKTDSSKTSIEESQIDSLDDYIPEKAAPTSSPEQISSNQSVETDVVSSTDSKAVQSSTAQTVGEKIVSSAESTSNETYNGEYYANTNSMKFHKSTCGSAKLIKETNLYKTTQRQELIDKGFSPCLRCNP